MRFLFIISLLLGLLNNSAALAIDCCLQADESSSYAQVDNSSGSASCHSKSPINDQHNHPESQCDCPMGVSSSTEAAAFPLVHFQLTKRFGRHHSAKLLIGYQQRLLRPPSNT